MVKFVYVCKCSIFDMHKKECPVSVRGAYRPLFIRTHHLVASKEAGEGTTTLCLVINSFLKSWKTFKPLEKAVLKIMVVSTQLPLQNEQ